MWMITNVLLCSFVGESDEIIIEYNYILNSHHIIFTYFNHLYLRSPNYLQSFVENRIPCIPSCLREL